MKPYGALRGPMEPYGAHETVSKNPYGALRSLRSPTEPCGAPRSPTDPTESYGALRSPRNGGLYEGLRSLWRPMKSYGALRNPAESYGALRSTMEPYGAQGGAQDGAHRTVPKNFLDDFQGVLPQNSLGHHPSVTTKVYFPGHCQNLLPWALPWAPPWAP